MMKKQLKKLSPKPAPPPQLFLVPGPLRPPTGRGAKEMLVDPSVTG